jgi:hypothetical protein
VGFTGSGCFTGFEDYYKDCYKGSETRKELQEPIKRLRASVKQVGAIQVFCLRTSSAESLSGGGYKLSRVFDDVSFCQNPYLGRQQRFQVSTAYKTKANKVRLVDPRQTDSFKPRGCLDWLERSRASNVPCGPRMYTEWITPKFSDIRKGTCLTNKQIKDLVVRDSLWPKEKEVFLEMLYNQEKAIAFDFSHIRKVKLDVAPP